MRTVASETALRIADEVWIVVALLHREHPESQDFSIEQIVARARAEKLTASLRPGFYVHVVQHCVANRAPNPGRYRVLFETSEGRRRLFRPGDVYHPERASGRSAPQRESLPKQFCALLDWYAEWSAAFGKKRRSLDPLLELRGSGKQLWAEEHADEYVRRLRENWE